ncbi:MAG: cytochrome c biogenesis protein CcsA [Prolixibacteraceae bacterium]
MKKIVSFLFSMFFSVVLLLIFAISIGYATFIENDYGTPTAQVVIYQAKWFEILLLLGILNLIGSMFKYKLFTRKKWAILLFHLAFVCIIIGAGVTRYFGFEGSMHIREGGTTNKVVSEASYINLEAISGNDVVKSQTQVKFTPNSNNSYEEVLSVGSKEITVENEIFVPNASEITVPDETGQPIISMLFSDGKSMRSDFFLEFREKKVLSGMSFGFETGDGSANIVFSRSVDGGIQMISADTVWISNTISKSEEKLIPNVLNPVVPNQFYVVENSGFILRKYLPKAKPSLVQLPNQSGMSVSNAFTAKISSGNEIRRVNVFESRGEVSEPVSCTIDGITLNLTYGPILRELPFSIMLRDFQIERYPGSNSPSSYASEITLKDPNSGVERPFRIFMNNILNYSGYRFFQSSFDQDELGTVLSVNQDYWGTLISYLGYFLMTLGMVFTVFSKQSRFQQLVRLSGKLQAKRQIAKIILLGLVLTGFGSLNNNVLAVGNTSGDKHIKAFGELLVQDHQGRIEPVNTLASDLLRKISKKDSWEKMSAVEVFLDMSANPGKWHNVPVIKVANPDLASILGASGGFLSYAQMFDQTGNYRLNNQVQESYNKKQTERNKLDKEIINVDERVNIMYQIFNGDFLKIFPVPNDENKTWVIHTMLPKTMKKQEVDFAANILNLYYEAYNTATQNGAWAKADEYLGYISKYQVTYGADIIPSPAKVQMEILYNEWNVFGKLAKILAFFGFILLGIHFMLIFKPTARIEKLINSGTILLFVAFVFYTAGLILRWYISGHAPWSNGYETMIFVGWATLLSGFIFVRRSPITLAVTAILTAIILFVAGMSWMNPEITNLVPVLKSYWLVVHVAIITASYGFLAMGAILGMLNLVLMILRNKNNNQKISITILEVSYIIEMALIIGLFMLTIGAFIGGVWANESWGRYWGWDPKETWALVTVLVYTIVLHLRKVPGLKSVFGLSSLALGSLSSVLMTFFGVNYYLSGMHSYAQGNPPPIPNALYISIVLIIALIIAARYSEKRMEEIIDPEDIQE